MRGLVCHLQLLLALASAFILGSDSRGTRDHIKFYKWLKVPNFQRKVKRGLTITKRLLKMKKRNYIHKKQETNLMQTANFALQPWRGRWNVSPEYWLTFNGLQGVISQMEELSIKHTCSYFAHLEAVPSIDTTWRCAMPQRGQAHATDP
jgi:hypothetical protein